VLIKNVGVDAGMIMVADMDYLNDQKKRVPFSVEPIIRKVKNGIYTVAWSIKNTWNGDIDGWDTLKVTSGEIFISDPCYVIGGTSDEEWMEWLTKTVYGDDLDDDRAFIIASMGGDGSYNLKLDFELDPKEN